MKFVIHIKVNDKNMNNAEKFSHALKTHIHVNQTIKLHLVDGD